jgi:cob(I)alamin adenosyltransferase
MPKLYTKTGDNGTTSLYDGSRLKKNSIFFDVLGDLDELASHIGLLCAKINDESLTMCIEFDFSYSIKIDKLREIQVKLLDIGSNIAVVDEKKKEKVPKLTEQDVKKVESWIDECEHTNTKLTEFLLTGVRQADSQCNICRCVSRRVERGMWKLNEEVEVDTNILKYMNRLSDFFFAFARNLAECKEIKVSDIKKTMYHP